MKNENEKSIDIGNLGALDTEGDKHKTKKMTIPK